MAKKIVKTVKADYPHIETKRTVKIWTKKEGRSFQMSIEGIGGRFYGSWSRHVDGEPIGELLVSKKISKPAGINLKSALKGVNKSALKQALMELLSN